MTAVICEGKRDSELYNPQNASVEFASQVGRHPFLVRCRDGSVSFQELLGFLVQHGKYSRYFTRCLCALMSQLEEGEDVLLLAENLSEELGYGESRSIPHSVLYASLLDDFGLSPEQYPTNPETQNLIDVMFMLCRQPRGLAGLGALCLGAEAIVPVMYSSILAGFRAHGIALSRLEFFSIHIDCDDDHANTMRAIIARQVSSSRSNSLVVFNAAEVAISARLRFFDGLTQGAQ